MSLSRSDASAALASSSSRASHAGTARAAAAEPDAAIAPASASASRGASATAATSNSTACVRTACREVENNGSCPLEPWRRPTGRREGSADRKEKKAHTTARAVAFSATSPDDRSTARAVTLSATAPAKSRGGVTVSACQLVDVALAAAPLGSVRLSVKRSTPPSAARSRRSGAPSACAAASAPARHEMTRRWSDVLSGKTSAVTFTRAAVSSTPRASTTSTSRVPLSEWSRDETIRTRQE